MNPQQYQQAAIGLCRQFKPITDKPADHSHEFTFSGWRVHLNFRHRATYSSHWFDDWIHIRIYDCHNLPSFCDHWKWNIHYSGDMANVRAELLRELLRRLEKLAEHYDHTPEEAEESEADFRERISEEKADHEIDLERSGG